MKKFSNVINESKVNIFNDYKNLKKPPFIPENIWNEKFKPMIDFIVENDSGIFERNILSDLDNLFDRIGGFFSNDFLKKLDKNNPKEFFDLFKIINTDKFSIDDINEIILPIVDKSHEENVIRKVNMDGYYMIIIKELSYKNGDESIEDIMDIYTKLKMLDCYYIIELYFNKKDDYSTISSSACDLKLSGSGQSGHKYDIYKDRLEDILNKRIKNTDKLSMMKIYLYNRETYIGTNWELN